MKMRAAGGLALVLLALVAAWAPSASAFSREEYGSSSDFYQLVEDVVAGRDYYAFLEITPEQASEPAELKKAFRALTRRWYAPPLCPHPPPTTPLPAPGPSRAPCWLTGCGGACVVRCRHPDKNPSAEAAERFRQVVFAYDILSNPAKKEHYDTLRTKGTHYAWYA